MDLQLLQLPSAHIITGEMDARNLVWNLLVDQASNIRSIGPRGATAEAIERTPQLSMLSYELMVAADFFIITGEEMTVATLASRISSQADSWMFVTDGGMGIPVKVPEFSVEAAEQLSHEFGLVPYGWQLCDTHECMEPSWRPEGIGCAPDAANLEEYDDDDEPTEEGK